MRRSPSASLSLCNSSILILCILIFSTLSFAAAPDRITGPIAGQLVKLSAGVSLKAHPGDDRGRVDSSLKLGYMTLLTVPSASQQKALNQLLSQQQDPRSPLYHMWLTPEQYADRFGLSPNDIQKLTAWLQSQGFTVVNVARGRNFIVFSGTAAQAETVFQTEIHNFDVGGEKHFSNTTPPSIPAALSGVVTGIRGLSNFRAQSHAVHSKPNYTEAVGNYWIAPGDITTMYDLQKLYDAGINGSGQTLAVIGETDVYLADLNDFRSGFDLPLISGCTFFADTNVIKTCSTTNFQYVVIKGDTDPGAPDSVQPKDLVEADIDLEWSAAVAPQALIIYVNAPDDAGNGVYDSMYYTIDQALAPVMTMSYSFGCELGEAENGTFVADEAEFAKANTEGITFLNASGDNGAVQCDPNTTDKADLLATGGLSVTYPASSPSVTGVGGTMIPWTELNSTYWNTPNGTTGGSVNENNIPAEQGWNDAQEWGAYCVANPGDTANCSGITSWGTAQAQIGIFAGGGGPSNCVHINGSDICTGGQAQPAWQSGISASAINPNGFGVTTTPARYVPDVSLLASLYFPGFIACTPVDEIESGSNTASICANGIAASLSTYGYAFGGTSFSSPMFAGIVTLLNQYLDTGKGLGNINPTLYSLAATPANGVFHQLGSNAFSSTGSNGVYCDPGTPDVAGWPVALQCPKAVKPATEGFFGYDASNFDPTTNYNLVTGLGSVDGYNLVHSWTSATTPSFTLAAASGSMTIIPGGAGGTDIITVADVNGFTGDVSLAASGLPSGVTAGFSSNPTAGTSTLTLTASGSAATGGPTTVTITGTSGSLTATTTVALTVNPSTTPGYSLSAGAANPTSVNPGSSSTATVTATPVNSYTGTVTLSCTISPVVTGATAPTCGLSPNPVPVTSNGGSSTVTFNTVAPSPDFQRALSGTRNTASASSNPNPTAKPSRMKLQFLALLLPISGLTLVGFVFGSSATQRRRMRVLGLICLLSTALVLLPSCGGGSSSSVSGCLAAPSVPTGLAASGPTSSGTTLTWTASTAPANCSLTGYTVYQNGTAIATTTSATYNVTGLTPGTQYSFTVAANDSFGVSAQSSAVSVTTTGTPGTPANTYTISITGKDANGVTQTGAAATVTVTVN